METVMRDDRGEYSVHTVECSDGHSLEVVKRDCGDYVEVTPRGSFVNHGGIKLTVKRSPDDPDVIPLPFPEIPLKFPKNLPEDMNERVKIFTRIRNEGIGNVLVNIIESYKRSLEMAGKTREEVDEVVKETVKRLFEGLKNEQLCEGVENVQLNPV